MENVIKKIIKNILLFPLIIFIFSFGCEKSVIVVDPEGEFNSLYLVSTGNESVKTIIPFFEKIRYSQDSALTLDYAFYEDILNYRIDTTEVFSTILKHRLNSMYSLDYGFVSLEVDSIHIACAAAYDEDLELSYRYTSTISNNQKQRTIKLGVPFELEIINSKKIFDFKYNFQTLVRNEIINLESGKTISPDSDLELLFKYPLIKGSILTLGYGSFFVKIEPLKATNIVKILKEDLRKVYQNLKIENARKCQIGYVEGYNIGNLNTIDKNLVDKYQLPVFQFSRCYKTVFLGGN